eukprot:scaffold7017_cov170-Alexandrium_tamarense.AAC.1
MQDETNAKAKATTTSSNDDTLSPSAFRDSADLNSEEESASKRCTQGLSDTTRTHVHITIVASLLQVRYQVRVDVLTSSSYGDPQMRRRLIRVAARSVCLLLSSPLPIRGDGMIPIKTCKDAIQMLERYNPTSSNIVMVNDAVIYNHFEA